MPNQPVMVMILRIPAIPFIKFQGPPRTPVTSPSIGPELVPKKVIPT
jgi:hypothetical protein